VCTPAAIPIVTTLIATGVTVAAQQQSTQFQEAVADRDAAQANLKAQDAVARGQLAEDVQRNRVRAIEGSQRAAIGGSGVQADSGTTGSVLSQTAQLGEQDARTIRTNAMREAWGYKSQASNFQLQGQLAGIQGQNETLGSLITGGARAYGIYAQQNPPTIH
jgi:hypothetical protein